MFDFLLTEAPVKLEGAPLVQVIAQIKFDSQLGLSTLEGANVFRDRLADRYPRMLSEQQQTVTVSAGPGGGVNTTAIPQWRLTDLSKSWSCVISPEQIALETKAYTTWIDMRVRLEEALGSLGEVANPRVRERIGLRYINHVRPNEDGSYDGHISGDLLGLLARRDWSDAVSASLAQTILREGSAQLALRYGTGTGVVEPEDMFVVDIDCSDEQPIEFDMGGILSYFDTFNDAAYRCFCACLPEKFRTTLCQ